MDWTAVDNGLIDWGGDGGDLDHQSMLMLMVTEGISFYSIQKRKGKEKVGQNQGLQVTQIVVVCCHKASVGQSDGHLPH